MAHLSGTGGSYCRDVPRIGAADYPAQELLRAWSADVFSRMDALLLLIWLTCAIFRIGFLCAAVRTVWQRAVQCGKGAAK